MRHLISKLTILPLATAPFFAAATLTAVSTARSANPPSSAVVDGESSDANPRRDNTRQAADGRRPQLQFINGHSETVEIYWINDSSGAVTNGTLPPGRQKTIQTTIGHRFEVRDRSGKVLRRAVSEVPIQAVRIDGRDPDGVPAFYTQRAEANGFPIVASSSVNPYALREAVHLVNMMLAQRPDVRDAMIRSGSRLCILSHDEFTTDQPEWAWMANGRSKEGGVSAKDYWDARARGMGGSQRDPFCSCAEENLLAYPGDPYRAECILIHELAHNIHLRGLMNVDPTFDKRLKKTFDDAMNKGLWKGKYASVNHHEYFAEGVQSWFDNNRENDHDHNHVNTRAELIQYDPELAKLCGEVFGTTKLRYTKPTRRLTGHLTGYDPSRAPRFRWPDRLNLAKERIRAAAESRGKSE